MILCVVLINIFMSYGVIICLEQHSYIIYMDLGHCALALHSDTIYMN